MERLKKVIGFYFIVGGIFFGWVAMWILFDTIKESFPQGSVLSFIVVCLFAFGLGWIGYWMISDELKRIGNSLFTPNHHVKNQPLTLVIASISAPLAFLYLGGWKVFLPIAIVGIGFDFLAATLNRDSMGLSEFMLNHWYNVPYGWFRVLGLVYFQYALCYMHVYNKRVEEGRDVEEIQSFKWGLYICVSLLYGIALVYVGVLVFVASLTWSGSLLKAITLSICSLYLAHRGMSWVQRQLKDYLVEKYAAAQEEFAEYQLFKYPRYLL